MVVEDVSFLAVEFVVDLGYEGVEFDLLILAELYGEYLVLYSVLVLISALSCDVIDGFVEVLLDELFFDLLAGLDLFAEHLGLADAVVLLAPLGLELLLLVVHMFNI